MKIIQILGYTWAVVAIPLAFIILGSSGAISKALFNDVKVSDRITGGDVVSEIKRDSYSVHIHEMVFDGFFFERSSGFVQVDFISDTELPLCIKEDIDFDFDDHPDFNISVNTVNNEYIFTPLSPKVKGLSDEEVYVFKKRRTVRIEIVK
jgi:hypothetical protein